LRGKSFQSFPELFSRDISKLVYGYGGFEKMRKFVSQFAVTPIGFVSRGGNHSKMLCRGLKGLDNSGDFFEVDLFVDSGDIFEGGYILGAEVVVAAECQGDFRKESISMSEKEIDGGIVRGEQELLGKIRIFLLQIGNHDMSVFLSGKTALVEMFHREFQIHAAFAEALPKAPFDFPAPLVGSVIGIQEENSCRQRNAVGLNAFAPAAASERRRKKEKREKKETKAFPEFHDVSPFSFLREKVPLSEGPS
jgi:hypothetical protein